MRGEHSRGGDGVGKVERMSRMPARYPHGGIDVLKNDVANFFLLHGRSELSNNNIIQGRGSGRGSFDENLSFES